MAGTRWLSPLTLAAAGVLFGVALMAFGIVALVRDQGGDSSPAASQDAWAKSAAPAPMPAMLAQPAVSTGDGRSIETRVGNLDQLDLVVAAGDSANRLALVDVYSGEAVAVGTFGYNIYARLRQDPKQLLVADRSQAPSTDRLLVFDMNGAGFALAAKIPLPDRLGCQGNFCNWMYLPGDTVLMPHRGFVDTPECQPAGGDAGRCLIYSMERIDLTEPTGVHEIPIPLSPPCSQQPPSCVGPDVCGSMDVMPSPDGGSLIRCNDTFLRITPDGQPGAPFALTESEDSAVFGTVLPDGSYRAIGYSGRLYAMSSTQVDLGTTRLLTQSNLQVGAVARVDDTHALVSVFLSSRNTSELLMVDLENSEVTAEMNSPPRTWGIAVLDEHRAVLLLRTDADAELQQVDLVNGKLGAIVPLHGLPSLPSAIVR